MLTFLLLGIAFLALTQYLLYWIYRLSTWIIFLFYNLLSFTVTLALEKTNRSRPPKPPVPPKPVGYRSTQPTSDHGSKEVVQSQENHVPSIVVSNAEERDPTLPTDNNNNTGQEERRLAESSSPQEETTPKTIAPSAIAPKSTSDAIDALKADSELSPKSVMAREESFDSVENDVCCTNLASYFVHKAKALAHPSANKSKKAPPPKPPKPKKEDIERARRRLYSFGEEIPGGREGFRYADDESTESSVDYKDVVFENGKILAINRLPKPPKSDSPEPDPVVVECDYEPFQFPSRSTELDINVPFFEKQKLVAEDLSLVEDNLEAKSMSEGNKEGEHCNSDFLIESHAGLGDSEAQESHNQIRKEAMAKETESGSKEFVEAASEGTRVIGATEYENILAFYLKDDVKDELFAPTAHDVIDKRLNDLSSQNQQSSQQSDYETRMKSSDAKRRSPSEERHSWPIRGKKTGKIPPNRPPPPRRKCLSMSDGEQTVRSAKVKPPRPPPPTPPTYLKRKTGQDDPRPPPRQYRSRSKTLELPTDTIKSIAESSSSVRRSVSFTDRSKTKPDIKSMYSTIDTSKKQQSYDKMKFRPLPPPPAPPRTHSKRAPEAAATDNGIGGEDKTSLDISKSKSTSESVCQQIETPKEIKKKSPRSKKGDVRSVYSQEPLVPANAVADANANYPPPSQSYFSPDKQHDNMSRNKEQCQSDKGCPPKRCSSSTFYCDNINESCAVSKSGSKSPRSLDVSFGASKSPSGGTDSEVSGANADLDSPGSGSKKLSVKRTSSKSKTKMDRSSVFYCDILSDSNQPTEEPVQVLPGQASHQETNKEEDSDELMSIANSLRNELNSILERRRIVESTESDVPSSQDEHQGIISGMPSSSRSSLISLPESSDFPSSHSELRAQGVSSGRPSSSRSSLVSWQDSSDESDVEIDQASRPPTTEEKKRTKLKCIANELRSSEATFVDALRLLNEDFRDAVQKSSLERGAPIVPEDVINHIFRYLPQLQNLNENLLEEIERRTNNWNNYPKISDVIVKIGPFLKLYSSYIREFESVTVVLDDACRKYPHFGQLVKDFEAGDICHKLALKHFLLKPVQRIPQYRLLLGDYLHNLTPDSIDYEDTVKALQIVSDVANHANETMKQGDNFLKLVSIQNSLQTRHEIVKPGRVFLKEGELMKLSRRVMQSRWFILFNDSLLYLTPVQQGVYRINHELPLTGMRVATQRQSEYNNEFSVISVTRSFSLAAKSPEEKQEWITDLNRAIEENTVRRSTFIDKQMQDQGKSTLPIPDTALGKQAPVWIPDSRVTMCQICTTEFTITYRRHHCRACGKVVCSACSLHKASLSYLDNHLARVCDGCNEKLNEEHDRDSRNFSTSSTDHRTTDSEMEIGRSEVTRSSSHSSKMGGKRSNLPRVLKERIKREARKSPTPLYHRVRANDQGSDISGHLFLWSRRAWKRFWFVVKEKVLYTYKASEDIAAKKSLPLLGFSVVAAQTPRQGIDPTLIFELQHKTYPTLIFHAESVGTAERWVKAMQSATVL